MFVCLAVIGALTAPCLAPDVVFDLRGDTVMRDYNGLLAKLTVLYGLTKFKARMVDDERTVPKDIASHAEVAELLKFMLLGCAPWYQGEAFISAEVVNIGRSGQKTFRF